jgi:hypothetical protein
MATFTGYAEVLTPQHAQYKAYAAGIKKTPPGMRLADILERTGGVYEVELGLPEDFRKQIRQVAELSSDRELLAIADRGRAPVSLEHLRGIDPQTRIVCGHRIDYTPEESERLRLKQPPDLDPKDTIYIDHTEE